jgi:hypothetical protein
MTAGSGILHIETPPEELVMSGGLFHGFQLWVNLPSRDKWLPPKYQDLRAEDVGLLTSPDGDVLLRLIAGDLGDVSGPGTTHTPISMVHATLHPGARMSLPWRSDFNALVYVLNGNARFGADGLSAGMGQLVAFGSGDFLTILADERQESRSPNVDLLILGGKPIREPVAWYGPFVMNNKSELVQAFDDYESGKLGTIPADRIDRHPHDFS